MTKRDLVVASDRHHSARLLKYCPRPTCGPSFVKSRMLRPLQTHFLLFQQIFILVCIHAEILKCLLGFWPMQRVLVLVLAQTCGSNNHVSHRFKQCCISFVVQPGRSPGIKMCACAPGISSKNNNIHKTALIVFRPCRCQNVFKVWKLISPFKFKKLDW